VHEVVQGPQGLILGHIKDRAVDLIQVHPIGVQPAERILDGLQDVPTGVAPIVGVVGLGEVDFCRQDDLWAAPARKRLAHHPFALAGVVHVGRVKEIDAGIQGTVNDADGVRLRRGPAEVHGAQTER